MSLFHLEHTVFASLFKYIQLGRSPKTSVIVGLLVEGSGKSNYFYYCGDRKRFLHIGQKYFFFFPTQSVSRKHIFTIFSSTVGR